MKREEILKAIEEVISPCNSCYKEHRERCAKRVLQVVEKHMIPKKRLDYIPNVGYTEVNEWE